MAIWLLKSGFGLEERANGDFGLGVFRCGLILNVHYKMA